MLITVGKIIAILCYLMAGTVLGYFLGHSSGIEKGIEMATNIDDGSYKMTLSVEAINGDTCTVVPKIEKE